MVFHILMSLSSASLNSSKHNPQSSHLYLCSNFSEAVFNKDLTTEPVLCENVVELTCSALSMYLKRSFIHLLTVKHLFSNSCCHRNLGSFLPWCFKLAVPAHDRCQQCNVPARNIFQLHVAFALITLNSTCIT